MKFATLTAVLATVLLSAQLAPATITPPVLTSKAAVATVLGNSAQIENFQKFSAAPKTAYALDARTLNSSTVGFHQGAGLVNSGLSFTTSAGSSLQWLGVGADSNTTRALMFNLAGAGSVGTINFATPTPAFGMDLIGISSSNTLSNFAFIIDVYSASNTLLYSQSVALDGNVPVFFGYESSANIGSITLIKPTASSQQVSTDFLTYSAASSAQIPAAVTGVPEPAAAGMLAIAALTLLRRRSHEPTSRPAFPE